MSGLGAHLVGCPTTSTSRVSDRQRSTQVRLNRIAGYRDDPPQRPEPLTIASDGTRECSNPRASKRSSQPCSQSGSQRRFSMIVAAWVRPSGRARSKELSNTCLHGRRADPLAALGPMNVSTRGALALRIVALHRLLVKQDDDLQVAQEGVNLTDLCVPSSRPPSSMNGPLDNGDRRNLVRFGTGSQIPTP